MNRTSPTMASTVRLRLITLVTLLALALAALPVPAAYAATITISDQASCESAGGELYDGVCGIGSYTVASGNTLVIVGSPTLSIVDFQDLTVNGTLQFGRHVAVWVFSRFTNNGTIEINGGSLRIRFRNGGSATNNGVINMNSGQLVIAPNVSFLNTGTISGGDLYNETNSGTLTNNGTITLACGSIFEPGNYSGAEPVVADDCTGPTDTTAPTITPQVSGTLGGNGWYTSNVTVSWSVVDNESAISSSTGCDTTTISTDTAGSTLTCEATSAGGTTSQSVTIKRDATAPTLAPTVSPNPVLLNGTATATSYASDALSGLASSNCDAIATSSVGPQTVRCRAIDQAGNTATANASYSVTYAFSGFAQPVDGGSVLNSTKAGQVIPLKWRLTDANGVPVTNLTTVQVRVTSLNCGSSTTVDAIETYAVGESGLKNLGNGYYQFNWKSPKSYAGLCKTLSLNLGEGSTALFQFK